jgi:hypothetical protein
LLRTLCACLLFFSVQPASLGATLDTIGVTLLRSITNLDGATVRVAHAEAGAPAWQVNPTVVGQPISLFLYRSAAGTTNAFPNDLGTESDHANGVGAALYGRPGGVATNVTQVIQFDADYFINSIVAPRAAIGAPLVNQSFIFSGSSVSAQQQIDSAYDNYSARSNVLFVSAVGNGGGVSAPGTAYNGIGVGAYGGGSSVGPTPDNGRSKPDLVAPAEVTSFATPLVTGAAALLLQAGARGDGGADTNAATDMRTVKALLLNGALKPADWNPPAPAPLDARYGAGVLQLFNSWMQLSGGKQAFITSSSVATGTAHPPSGATGNVGKSSGWDFNTCTSTLTTVSTLPTPRERHSFPPSPWLGIVPQTLPASTILICICMTWRLARSSPPARARWTTWSTCTSPISRRAAMICRFLKTAASPSGLPMWRPTPWLSNSSARRLKWRNPERLPY